MLTTRSDRQYLPAAGHDWFLPLYDPLTSLLGVDAARRQLLDQSELATGHAVLDVGCGTGTLAVLIKRLYPTVEVIGVDPDPRALHRARNKAERARVAVRFDQAYADALAYPDRRFDRVFSSMMFHHLESGGQAAMLKEIARTLKPDGRLELLDFAGAEPASGGLSRVFHAHQRLQGNTPERILTLMTRAGFRYPRLLQSKRTLFGRIAFFQGTAPGA